MARINNSDLTKEIIDGAKINISHENVPGAIADKVVPVMEVNPKLLLQGSIKVTSGTRITTGDATIMTTHLTKRTFITSLVYSITKDATCDVAMGYSGIATTIATRARTLASVAHLTTTASSQTVAISFKTPIEIDKGVNIIFGTLGAYTVGLCSRSAQVNYIELED